VNGFSEPSYQFFHHSVCLGTKLRDRQQHLGKGHDVSVFNEKMLQPVDTVASAGIGPMDFVKVRYADE
jgi:hypothetical protein